jgi:hypothetical protein
MTRDEKIIRNKVGVLELAKQLGSVSQACRIMGFSRDSFYRFKDLYEKGGEAALIEMSRRVPNPRNRIGETIERRILEITLEQPAWGHTRMADELAKEGLRVSPTGVRGALVRHDLNTMAKRLKALEARVAQDGLILTESQLAALEKAKADKEAHGEFDSACPGYCGAQDTFYVGTLKGVGRIYQQTFVDTYAKVGFTKLYDVKTAITAADLLNDRALPFYEEHGIPLCRVLTDRGSEYCGNPERHEYELYLAIEDIDHSRTKTKSPQTTDVIDKSVVRRRRLSLWCARVTAWRRAGYEAKARPRSRHCRSSFAAPGCAFGPRGCQPVTNRSYAFSACSTQRRSSFRTGARL